MENMKKEKVLDVNNLNISFNTYAGEVKAVRGVSFEVYEGESLALVGESGCGKTVTSKAILQILPSTAVIKKDSSINYCGEEVLKLNRERMKKYKGYDAEMIFKHHMT